MSESAISGQEKKELDWLQFHQVLKEAGLTKQRAAFQTRIGRLVEDVAAAVVGISGESYYDWMMTGSFVEGWGNNLFRLDGVTGADSDIDWSQVVKHKVYHLGETCNSVVDCINRKDYKLKDGHIVVKNSSQQPAFDTKRHGLRPDTDECHAYPCCSYPKTVLDKIKGKKVHGEFLQILKTQFDNEEPQEDVHFVRASVPGEVNQLRLSCTKQERFIMGQLSTVQGQLFTVLKYLFKTKEDESRPESEKKIIESVKSYHAKTLLMTLLRNPDSWPSGGNDDEEEADDVASKRLEWLVWRALGFLFKSISKNLLDAESDESTVVDDGPEPQQPLSRQVSSASSATGASEKKEKVPRVLEHALLTDCGLYLKPKRPKDEPKRKSLGVLNFLFSSQQEQRKKTTTEKEAHANALEKMKEDLLGLIGKRTDLVDILRNQASIIVWQTNANSVKDLEQNLENLREQDLKGILEEFEKRTLVHVQRKSQDPSQNEIQVPSQNEIQVPSQNEIQCTSDSGKQSQTQSEIERQRQEDRAMLLRKRITNLYEKLSENGKLDEVLLTYQNRVTEMSNARKQYDEVGQDSKFLFIPLAMLPRITLDTLLEEQRRRQDTESRAAAGSESETTTKLEPETTTKSEPETTTKSEPETTTKSEPETTTKSEPETTTKSEPETTTKSEPETTTKSEPETTTKSEPETTTKSETEAATESATAGTLAYNVLKEAYIKVWIVLRSLGDSDKPDKDGDHKEAQNAKNWIKQQPFLKTTSLCLQIMELHKYGKEAEIIQLLSENDCRPTRWIQPTNDFDFAKLLSETDCIWIFHYFIRPKTEISYKYLNELQDPIPKDSKVKTEKQVEYEKGERREFQCIDGVRKDWLIHLVVNQDDKKSRQPSLTVNFDGLLDRFRRRFLPRTEDQAKDDYLATMQNCLFDPRTEERLREQRSKKK